MSGGMWRALLVSIVAVLALAGPVAQARGATADEEAEKRALSSLEDIITRQVTYFEARWSKFVSELASDEAAWRRSGKDPNKEIHRMVDAELNAELQALLGYKAQLASMSVHFAKFGRDAQKMHTMAQQIVDQHIAVVQKERREFDAIDANDWGARDITDLFRRWVRARQDWEKMEANGWSVSQVNSDLERDGNKGRKADDDADAATAELETNEKVYKPAPQRRGGHVDADVTLRLERVDNNLRAYEKEVSNLEAELEKELKEIRTARADLQTMHAKLSKNSKELDQIMAEHDIEHQELAHLKTAVYMELLVGLVCLLGFCFCCCCRGLKNKLSTKKKSDEDMNMSVIEGDQFAERAMNRLETGSRGPAPF